MIVLLAISVLVSPVLAASITLTPNHGSPLSIVTITGSFASTASGLATISFDGAVIGQATVTSGALSGSFQVPLKPRDVYLVAAQIGSENGTAQFTVTPQINLSASAGYVGDQITVTGNGFSPSSVALYFDNSTTPLANTSANASGVLTPVTITIPAATKASHIIKAVDAAGSANAAFASFAVSPRMTLTPSAGGAGDQITATGIGFAGSSSIVITIDGDEVTTSPSSIPTDNKGGFIAVFVVPADAGRGAHSVIATDLMDNTAAAVLTIEDKIILSASSGFVGDTIEVKGTGFAANKTITLYFDTTVIPTTNLRTDSSGAFPATNITIPAATRGSHTIKARDANDNQATSTFAVNSKVTTSKDSGVVGTEVTVSGSGFAASTPTGLNTVSLALDNTYPLTPVGSGIITTDDKGSFTTTFTIPGAVNGEHIVFAEDAAGNTAQANLIVEQKILLSATTGAADDQVNIAGTGFAADKQITIKYNGKGMSTEPATVTTDANGGFSANIVIPSATAGTYTIEASDGANTASESFIAEAVATIDKATSQSSPGFVGMDITINGAGFKAYSAITVTLESTPTQIAATQSDASGSFSVACKIPAAPAGEHTIKVSDGTTTQEFTFIMESSAPGTPSLLLPANNSKPKQPVTFSWNSVSDPSGVVYDLQIGTDASFTTLVLEQKALTGTEYAMADEDNLPSVSGKAPYYWRVRAVDGASNTSAWATAATFVTGFIWPGWLTHFLYAIGIMVALYIGMRLGHRIAYRSNEYSER